MSIINSIKGWFSAKGHANPAFDLERFVTAQENQYKLALQEVSNGRKTSHWIWYIFPQIQGLGHSAYASLYGINSLAEAEAYLAHPILNKHLREITNALLSHKDKSAKEIFGGVDAMKVRSCMTLFNLVSPNDIFKDVLDVFYDGKLDQATLQLLKTEKKGKDVAIPSLVEDNTPAHPQYDYTPEKISTLAPNEVFVFGSNLAGRHGGGAAAAAVRYFGAIWGQGVGLQGQSYAIPTMQGGVETIKPYVDEFISFAKLHPGLVFLVTRIGCGIAGFRDSEIAPLFGEALHVDNIVLPRSFVEYFK